MPSAERILAFSQEHGIGLEESEAILTQEENEAREERLFEELMEENDDFDIEFSLPDMQPGAQTLVVNNDQTAGIVFGPVEHNVALPIEPEVVQTTDNTAANGITGTMVTATGNMERLRREFDQIIGLGNSITLRAGTPWDEPPRRRTALLTEEDLEVPIQKGVNHPAQVDPVVYFEKKYGRKYGKPILLDIKEVVLEPEQPNEEEEVLINYNELADTLAKKSIVKKYGAFNEEEHTEEYNKLLTAYVELILKHKRKTNA